MANNSNEASYKEFEVYIDKVIDAIQSRELKERIQEECVNLREQIMQEKEINQIEHEDNSANSEKVAKYLEGNGNYIEGNTIVLYNNSYLKKDELTHFFNEKNRDENYPDGLSLAQLVEYGSGYSKPYWVYKGDDGEKVLTYGKEGKYIYYELYLRTKENALDWVEDYLSSKIKG